MGPGGCRLRSRLHGALNDTVVDLDATRMCLQLYKDVPVFLVFRDMMSKSGEKRLVASLALPFGLRMVRDGGKVLDSKEVA